MSIAAGVLAADEESGFTCGSCFLEDAAAQFAEGTAMGTVDEEPVDEHSCSSGEGYDGDDCYPGEEFAGFDGCHVRKLLESEDDIIFINITNL